MRTVRSFCARSAPRGQMLPSLKLNCDQSDSQLRLVSRHELGRIPSLNCLQLCSIEQAYLAQTCRGGLRREERKIGPEQDLRRRHQFGERRQWVDGHGIGRIIVEPLHIVGGASRKTWLQILACGE